MRETRQQPAESGPDLRSFPSILFERRDDRPDEERLEAPACFADLNLDQIVDTITAGRDEYHLKPFFYAPLTTTSAIQYRHDVMRDLEHDALFESVRSFSQRMRAMREHLTEADKRYYRRQKQAWFLDAVGIYCDAVRRLAQDLGHTAVSSRGFAAIRDYLRRYADSDRLTALAAEVEAIKADLSAIRYCLLIQDNSIKVRRYEDEADYSIDVLQTFERFKQGAVTDYTVTYALGRDMNHVEAQVLDFVAQLNPDVFRRLDEFVAQHGDFQDEAVRVFDREIQFYVAYRDYVDAFRRAGLRTCYPRVSTDKDVYNHEGYDFALAHTLIADHAPVVCNDFYLRGAERIIVVSGPNQGGKTTFARAFGQIHYLASLGCPVAGRDAHTFLFDRLFTHFEKEEDIANLRGKLEDDLVRIHDILTRATPASIIIMNEIFTSTTLQDAVVLSRRIMDAVVRLDALCVCVTFIDELASLGDQTVSMVSTVVPEDPAQRTYKIVRQRADGLAYAISVAEKHRLTYERLKERLRA
jgi:DNA mismatch repair protein MutS